MAKRYRFTVSGKSQFPFDMLRYDACYPISTEAAMMMSASTRIRDDGGPRETFHVELMMSEAGRRPTDARWLSFAWTVTDVKQV